MNNEYDEELRKKIRNISTEAPSSSTRAAKALIGDDAAFAPKKRPEGVENGYIAAWKEKEQFYREYTPVKLNELLAEMKELTAMYGIRDRDYLKALEDLILNYNKL